MIPNVSVLIPIYNQMRNLSLVLRGLENQSMREFELILGDDGSGEETRAFVQGYRSSYPIKHVWQPDEGFRRSKILNEASKLVESQYCIFMDSDCIPHHDFVRDHWEARSPMSVLCGRRVDLGDRVSALLTPDAVGARAHEKISWELIQDIMEGGTLNWEESIRLPHPVLGRLIHRRKPALLGSNFSLHHPLFEQVNGFNEDYVGYGLEDSDLAYRLELAGAELVTLRHRAIQYHLFHPKSDARHSNQSIFDETIHRGSAICPNGLRKL